jgi:hypothetical protein
MLLQPIRRREQGITGSLAHAAEHHRLLIREDFTDCKIAHRRIRRHAMEGPASWSRRTSLPDGCCNFVCLILGGQSTLVFVSRLTPHPSLRSNGADNIFRTTTTSVRRNRSRLCRFAAEAGHTWQHFICGYS